MCWLLTITLNTKLMKVQKLFFKVLLLKYHLFVAELLKMKSILRAWNFASLLLVGLVSCQMSPPGGSPPPGMTPSSSSDNSCTQYMNCVSGDSNSMVTFDHSSGNDTVLINMTTRAFNTSGWMAVAFSYNNQMVRAALR